MASPLPETPRSALDRLGRAPRLRLAWLSGSVAVVSVLGGVGRRLLDLAVGLVGTVLTAPVALVTAALAASRKTPWIRHRTYLGRGMSPVQLGELPSAGPFARLPWLWALLRGDLTLVGPAPTPEEERAALGPADLPRFQVRPGLANLFRLREAANIAFEGRSAADLEQVHTAGFARELGILVRSVPAALIGVRVSAPPREIRLLDVRIDNWTMEGALAWIAATPRGARTRQLAFVNPDCLNKAFEQPGYREVLARADVVLPDGIGIHYACRMTGTALAANVNGTDLFPRLCAAAEESGRSVYFLGARPGVVEALVVKCRERWPRLQIAGRRDGFFARGGDEERAVVDAIRASSPDLLLVAFGAPSQDLWIAAQLEKLGARVAIGVGGLFDFYSGRVARAPQWMRELGLEWVWRLLQEPGRMWRRYVIGNPLFLYRVWRWRRRGPYDDARSPK